MPKAILPFRTEEIFAGFFHYTLTDVFYGHDGISGLKHFVPFAQSEWHHFTTQGHQLTHVHDSVTSRISARIESVQAAARTSIIRKRVILPTDFGSWVASGLRFIVFRGASAPVSFNVSLFKDGVVDPGISGVDIQAVGSGSSREEW